MGLVRVGYGLGGVGGELVWGWVEVVMWCGGGKNVFILRVEIGGGGGRDCLTKW